LHGQDRHAQARQRAVKARDIVALQIGQQFFADRLRQAPGAGDDGGDYGRVLFRR
jgi:hypothetical protein